MAATILALPVDKDATTDPLLEIAEVEALAALAEIIGTGLFSATDFAVSAPGGLACTIGAGRAIVRGADGELKVAYRATSETYDNAGSGLPTSQATLYIWLKRDGTYTHTTSASSPQTGALLLALGSTNGTDFSLTSTLPAGRKHLGTTKTLSGTVTVDPGSITTLESLETAVTIPGAEVGDLILFNVPASLETGIVYSGARISAANTAQLRLSNITGGSVDPASRTWTYVLIDLT